MTLVDVKRSIKKEKTSGNRYVANLNHDDVVFISSNVVDKVGKVAGKVY